MGQSAGSVQTPGAEKTRLSVSIAQPGLAQQHPDTQSSTDSQARLLTSFGSQKPRKQSRVEMQSAEVEHGTSPPQTFGVPSPPQVAGAVHVPQFRVPPQPSEMFPQFLLCAAHVVGVQQTFATQVPAHVPQSRAPPHPSEIVPQFAPCPAHVVGVQPHTFGVPPPPQVSGEVQDPHSIGCGQVPLETVPQFAPCPAHVVGVQHTPNGFEPGGAPLTHAPLQQL
jgi:hypothetical protein